MGSSSTSECQKENHRIKKTPIKQRRGMKTNIKRNRIQYVKLFTIIRKGYYESLVIEQENQRSSKKRKT